MKANPAQKRIIKGVLLGEPWACDALYRISIAPIASATRRTAAAHRADQEDLRQLAFERLLLSLRRGQFGGRTSLESWAWLIATRVTMDFIRRRQRERSLHSLVEPDAPEVLNRAADVALDTRLEHRADVHRVQRALAEIGSTYSDILDFDLRGYYASEVGDLLGISVAAVQTRLSRARRALSLELSRTMGEGSTLAV